ncbi:hypothetical protein [Thalassotalea sp. ND16A]|uniref:hypothetical protein n=1 Tax=Thalassotalea sp. ND16A TaxID=1535422 RepID=UPI00051A5609|nr:hypothetical protein [Thalassotalea sp. ND16A]KGK00375.1 hypothetical protein ND16A_3582 [Thalassotalea sp. ND16A]
MNISERQFQYLQTMGVSLWQSREQFFKKPEQANTEHESTEPENIEQPDLSASSPAITPTEQARKAPVVVKKHSFDNIEQVLQAKLITDIAIVLDITSASIKLTDEGVIFGPLLWQFNATDSIEYKDNRLISPELGAITSNAMKAKLWVCLAAHINNH